MRTVTLLRRTRLVVIPSVVVVSACAHDVPQLAPVDPAAHEKEWTEWKVSRVAQLRRPGRPLSYTGLHWLHAGRNTIGADSANDVVLPGRGVPKVLGALVRDGAHVRFEPAPGASVTVDSAPAVAGPLRTDADSAGPSRVRVGSAGFRIIKRVDSLGVRAWDAENAAIRDFPGIQYFPLDPRWRYAGRFIPLATPKRVPFMTSGGVFEEEEIVGAIETRIGGRDYRLTAFDGGPDELFLVFADSTSGDESYGFRFLYAPLDTATKAVTLDFNFAFNPDCAFSRFTTCALPPAENRIQTAIRGGERRFGHDPTAPVAAKP